MAVQSPETKNLKQLASSDTYSINSSSPLASTPNQLPPSIVFCSNKTGGDNSDKAEAQQIDSKITQQIQNHLGQQPTRFPSQKQ